MGYVHHLEEGQRVHGIMVTVRTKTFDIGLYVVDANVQFERLT